MVTKTSKAGERLVKDRAKADIDKTVPTPTISGPEQGPYGVFQQGYGQALAADANNPYGSGASMYALSAGADLDARRYSYEQEQTRQAQLQAQKVANTHAVHMLELGKTPDTQLLGTYGGVGENDMPVYNIPGMTQENNMTTRTHDAAIYGDRATGNKSNYDAGLHVDPTQAAIDSAGVNQPSDTIRPFGVNPSAEPGVYFSNSDLNTSNKNWWDAQNTAYENAIKRYRAENHLDDGMKYVVTQPAEMDPQTGRTQPMQQWTMKGGGGGGGRSGGYGMTLPQGPLPPPPPNPASAGAGGGGRLPAPPVAAPPVQGAPPQQGQVPQHELPLISQKLMAAVMAGSQIIPAGANTIIVAPTGEKVWLDPVGNEIPPPAGN